MALELITKQDNVEIIRDQIAAILVTEVANQVALATTAGEPDPQNWNMRIFTERSNPWEQFMNSQTIRTPLVNVWFDSENFDPKASNVSERQKTEAVFNIDCYGYGKASDNVAGGHNPGDKEAALEVQKAIRFVRNILMASENTYLQLQGTVWSRWPQSITSFQPQLDAQNALQIVGARVALRVTFNEFSPQAIPETLETLAVTVLRTEDGEIVLEAQYDYPLTP